MWGYEPGLFPFLFLNPPVHGHRRFPLQNSSNIYLLCMHVYTCSCVFMFVWGLLVCACMCAHVCTHRLVGYVHMCLCVGGCACLCVSVHRYVLVCVLMCVPVRVYVCACLCMCMCVYVCRPEIGIRCLSPSYWKILNYVYLFICGGEHEYTDRYEDHSECPGHSLSSALSPHSNTINPLSFSQQTQPWKPSLAFMFFPPASTHSIHSRLHSVFVLYHFFLRYQLPLVHFLAHAKPSSRPGSDHPLSDLPWPLQLIAPTSSEFTLRVQG